MVHPPTKTSSVTSTNRIWLVTMISLVFMDNRSYSVNVFEANTTIFPENFAHAIKKQRSDMYYKDKCSNKVTHFPENICHGCFWPYNTHFCHVRFIQHLRIENATTPSSRHSTVQQAHKEMAKLMARTRKQSDGIQRWRIVSSDASRFQK